MRKSVLIAMTLAAIAARAGTLHVDPTCNGSDDCYPTVAFAIAAAADGDTIVIRPGRHAGFDASGRTLTFISESGDSDNTALLPPVQLAGDGYATRIEHLGFQTSTPDTDITCDGGDVVFDGCRFGITIRLILAVDIARFSGCEFSGAVLEAACSDSASVTGSTLKQGSIDLTGTSVIAFSETEVRRIIVDLAGSAVRVADCFFSDCTVEFGTALTLTSGIGAVTRSRFVDNGSLEMSWSGAVRLDCDRTFVTHSLFEGNAGIRGGAVRIDRTGQRCVVDRCTFIGNESGSGSAIHYWATGADPLVPTIQNCIFDGQLGGPVVDTDGWTIAEFINTDIHHTQGGDWAHPYTDQLGLRGNISAPPCFCDPDAGDYGLCADSPCLPENNPGGESIMGWDPEGCPACGCGEVAVDERSFSELKNMFR